jgi:glycosyltransferase involved in cell wall biosynthesis
VVASARAALPEVVVDGVTGLLADPDAPSTFANALLTLLGNPDLISRMGDAARRVVLDKYTPERVYDRIAALQASALQPGFGHA